MAQEVKPFKKGKTRMLCYFGSRGAVKWYDLGVRGYVRVIDVRRCVYLIRFAQVKTIRLPAPQR